MVRALPEPPRLRDLHISHTYSAKIPGAGGQKQTQQTRGVQHSRTNPTSSVGQHVLGAASLTPQMWSMNSPCPTSVTGCEEPLNPTPHHLLHLSLESSIIPHQHSSPANHNANGQVHTNIPPEVMSPFQILAAYHTFKGKGFFLI